MNSPAPTTSMNSPAPTASMNSPAPSNDPKSEILEEDDENPFGVYPEADIAEYVAAPPEEEADGEAHPDYVLASWEEDALARENGEWFRWNQAEDGWAEDDTIRDWDGRYDSEPDDDTMLSPEEYAAELRRLGY